MIVIDKITGRSFRTEEEYERYLTNIGTAYKDKLIIDKFGISSKNEFCYNWKKIYYILREYKSNE